MSSLKDIPVITRLYPCPRRSAATPTPCLYLKPGEKKRHSMNERAGFPVARQKKNGQPRPPVPRIWIYQSTVNFSVDSL